MRQCCFIGKSSSKMLPLKCPVVESAANVQTERYYSCCAFHFVRRQTHGERGYPLYSLGSTVQEQIILTQIVVWEMEKRHMRYITPMPLQCEEMKEEKKEKLYWSVGSRRVDATITLHLDVSQVQLLATTRYPVAQQNHNLIVPYLDRQTRKILHTHTQSDSYDHDCSSSSRIG